LVKDLDRGDFRVWEDNVPQTIASLRHEDLPVSIGILVDNSGSMRDKRASVNAAALELVRTSNPDDAAFIVNFSDHAYLDQDLTSNIHELERGLLRVDSKGSTALYDAVVASADELAQHAKQPKQVVLIITDGEDNASRLTLEQAIHRVQRLGGPVVYTVGLLFDDINKDKSARARQALETLSADTGGIAYFPRSLQEVNQIAEEVARDIRNQYTIGYHSTKPASLGGYRSVRVEAKASKHRRLVVRTRTGYYPNQSQRPVQTAEKTP
jgi:Ca-activated chloride channel family protein